MFGARFNHEVSFFITGQKMPGIESVELSYDNSLSITKPLGYSKGLTMSSDKYSTSISLVRSLIFNDPLLNCTGNVNITGMSIHYDNQNYFLSNHIYMTEYLVNCAVGSIPKVTTNFICFNSVETPDVKGASGSLAEPAIYIPNQGSISLSCPLTSTNRVIGFNYSIKSQRNPFYSIGSGYSPVHVNLIRPLEYSASVEVEIDDGDFTTFDAYSTQKENVSLSIKGRNGIDLQNLIIPNASLEGQRLSSSSDGSLKLTLNYIGHL
jgi:hypothetical protein